MPVSHTPWRVTRVLMDAVKACILMSMDSLMTYGIKDVATMIGVSAAWVAYRIRSGEIEGVEIGGRYRVTRAAFERFIEKRAAKLKTDMQQKTGRFANRKWGGPRFVANGHQG